MNKIDLPKNHLALTASSNVTQICSSFFANFDINYFGHVRLFYDNSISVLASNAELVEHFFSENYSGPSISNKNKAGLVNGNYVLGHGDICPSNQLLEQKKRFGIDHATLIVEQGPGYDDTYMFATKPENINFINYFINNVDIFKAFTLLFKDRASELINKAEKNYRINQNIYSTKYIDTNHNKIIGILNKFLDYCAIPTKLLNTDTKISTNRGLISLSRREKETLWQLFLGKTAKEIANYLEISPRTVETYIVNLKQKLDCFSRSELIAIILQNRIFQ